MCSKENVTVKTTDTSFVCGLFVFWVFFLKNGTRIYLLELGVKYKFNLF